MAELGLACSVLQVLQVAGALLTQAYEYGEAVKNAEKDVKHIIEELKGTEEILLKLKALAEQEEASGENFKHWPTLEQIKNDDGYLAQCKMAMLDLEKKLVPADGWARRFWARCMWPRKKKSVEVTLKLIEKQKKSIMEFLEIEGMGQNRNNGHTLSQIKIEQMGKLKQEIVGWLFHANDHGTTHNAARKKHERGTGKWFIESEEFARWKDEQNSLLWLHGIPGCGKTVLCSEIIEQTRVHCSSLPGSCVVYFYFSFSDGEKQKITSLLRSILGQLVQRTSKLGEVVKLLHESYQHSQPPTDRLMSAIKSSISDAGEVYIVMDALDECPNENNERSELSLTLQEILKWKKQNIHILAVSRKENDLAEALEPLCTIGPISLESRAIDEDIQKFVKKQLSTDRKLKRWPVETQIEIEERLTKSAGMFRLVECQIEEVKKCPNALEVTATLKTLPSTLYEMYDRMLLKIEHAHQSKAIAALTWLSHSEHVNLQALSDAAIIDRTADPPFDVRNRFPDPRWILDVLSCFVTYKATSPGVASRTHFREATPPCGTVTLAHFTVKEYLSSSYILGGPCKVFHITSDSAREHIIRSSILYMNNYVLTANHHPVWQDLVDFPLLFKANDTLGFRRVDQNDFSPQTEEMIFNFLSSDSKRLTSLCIRRLPQNKEDKITSLPEGFELDATILCAARAGMDNIVRRLMSEGTDFNAEGHWTGPGLFHAIESRKPSTVKVFLDACTDVNLRNRNGMTPLTFAVNYKDWRFDGGEYLPVDSIVRMLLDAGADVNAEDKIERSKIRNRTALSNAVSMGATNIVKVLLDAGAHPDSSLLEKSISHAYYGEYGVCPSPFSSDYYCVRHGTTTEYCDIARTLLDAGAERGTLDDGQCRTLERMLKEKDNRSTPLMFF